MIVNISIQRRESIIIFVDRQAGPLLEKDKIQEIKVTLLAEQFNWSVTKQGCRPLITDKL